MPYFEGQELQPQVQLKGIPEKALEISDTSLRKCL